MKKVKVIGLLEYIIAMSIVINCNTIWDRTGFENINDIMLSIALIILTLISFNSLIEYKKTAIKVSILSLIIVIYNFIFIIINGQNTKSFLIRFIFILVALTICTVYSYKIKRNCKILINISNIMVILSAISLVFYILASCLNIIKPTGTIILQWGYERIVPTYAGLYYNTQSITLGGLKIIRNTGIFTEAPMYAFCICISLAVELFILKNIRIKNILILLITVFSTFSTTGIAVSLALLCIYILLKKSNNSMLSIVKTIVIPIVIIVSLAISSFFIISKIEESKNKYASYAARMDDFKVGIEAWKNNKLFGNGYERHDITQQYMKASIREGDMGGSSGLMMVLPQGGIYLVSMYIIPLTISLLYSLVNKKIGVLIISLSVFLLFIVTNIPYRYLTIYLLAIGWSLSIKSFDKIQ